MLSMTWIWLIIAATFLVIELVKTNGYTLWVSVAAAIATAITWLEPQVAVWIPAVVFILFSLTTCLWWYRSLKNKPIQLNMLKAKEYFGRVYVLEKPIKSGKGEIEIDGLVWFIHSDRDFAKGSKIRIKGANGVVLLVEPFES